MAQVTIPNRPAGTDQRSIEAILADFDAITNQINGNIDSTNVANTLAQSAGVNTSTQIVKGSCLIPTSQTTANPAYTTLPTPDQVSGIVLANPGLLAVWYKATWWSTNATPNCRADVFLNDNEMSYFGAAGGGSAILFSNGSEPQLLYSNGNQLATTQGASAYPGEVTTGETWGTPLIMFAAAGTYTVSVKFLTAGGFITTVKDRRLYVQALSFA